MQRRLPRATLLALTCSLFLAGRNTVIGQTCPAITEAIPLNSNAGTDNEGGYAEDYCPQITTDRQGTWMAVWYLQNSSGRDILFARSTDAGGSWTDQLRLNTNATSDSGQDSYPQLATDSQGTWIAVWRSGDDLDGTIGTDDDILISWTTDAGDTWSDPVPLNTNATSDSGDDRDPVITTDHLGTWIVAWISSDDLDGTIGVDYDILFSRSTDSGATWTPPTPLNTNAASDAGNDIPARLSTDGRGNWVAVWCSQDDLDGTIGTDSDILVARSVDGGETWTDPTPLNTYAATDTRGDGRPEITTDGSGVWLVVWKSGDILYARSVDNGATWSYPLPVTPFTSGDNYHDIATDGQGNWVAVWESGNELGGMIDSYPDILFAQSTDNGTTWTHPLPLNSNAYDPPDIGLTDERPQLSTDGCGNWVAVWWSTDHLNGTIGTDRDILTASFRLPCAPTTVSSDPPDGAIDARQDFSTSGLTPMGIDRVRLVFSIAVRDATTGAPPDATSFEIRTTSGRAPSILVVNPVDEMSNTYDVVFEDPIPPGAWTTIIAHVNCVDELPDEGSHFSIGFLPGDADGNGRSAPSDILRLVDNLNGVYDPPMEPWQCDIDRSGVCGPPDILRLIDLLNGVNTSQAWLNVSLPPRP